MLAADLEIGIASTYVDIEVACPGERYAAGAMAAAHRTLPCGSRVEVTNRKNGRKVVVRVNDRGPHVAGRIIDLTPGAALVIGLVDDLAEVALRVIGAGNLKRPPEPRRSRGRRRPPR